MMNTAAPALIQNENANGTTSAKVAPEVIKLTNMLQATGDTHEAGKYTLLFDKTNGLVPRFYHYKAKLIDFKKEVLKMQAFNQSVDSTKEVLRRTIVNHAKYGFTVALDINTQMPDWKSK